MGRRPELLGGDLIRRLGGWDEVKKMRHKGHERIKSDQRILGDGSFVADILKESEEQFAGKYRLKSLGYDFETILTRVSEIFKMEKDCITGKGRQHDRVSAGDLLCHWATAELGMSMVDLGIKRDLIPGAVSISVQRGDKLAKENEYHLEIDLFNN